ncbi:LGFP repeat-containing protein [Streptomyces sp. NPDC014724]|uniref:LGFP repeat-containing protein n=1 Tax=unclassified Streptomyces TaxID=2593676 RepID=UPI0036FE8B90
MTPRTKLLQRTTRLIQAAALALAALAALLVQAPTAAAVDMCGYQVGGDILIAYNATGGKGGPLGCPTTDELVTPDGAGRYNHFTGGSIYWTAQTGAHPVWGAIRDKWAALGWETGKLGYPTSGELTNPDGTGKRQTFQGGTVYWHPSYGAHPVWGKIGELWGQYGWEGGAFGYPTSDEQWDESYKSIYQRYSKNNLVLFWSAGNGVEGCTGECVGYSGTTGTDWFRELRVEIPYGTSNVVVRAFPTEAGFINARTDFQGGWYQMWSLAPYPNDVSQTEHNSLYEQYACHAKFADQLLPGEWNTGVSFDLESWRSDIGMEDATSLTKFLSHHCEWD